MRGVISTIFPIYLNDFLKIGAKLIGIVLGVRTVGACLATLVSGHISDKVGRKPIIFSGIFIESFCIYLYTLVSTFELTLLLALIEGLGAGMIAIALITWMSEQAVPDYMGSAVGLYRTFQDVGSVIGPVSIAAVQMAFDVYVCFFLGAAVLLANIPTLLTVSHACSKHRNHKRE